MRLVLSCLILVSLALRGEAAVIEMQTDAHVSKNIVRLSDVARVHDAGAEERAALEPIYVTLSPASGKAKTVALAEVRQRLRAHGVNLGTVIFEGPSRVTVRRLPADAPPPDADAHRSAAADLITGFVAEGLGLPAEEVDVAFDRETARRLERLAGRGYRLVVQHQGPAVSLGSNRLLLVGYAGTEARERVDLVATVRAYAHVPVAARNIARRAALAAGDVMLERRLVSSPDQAALTIDDLLTRRAARPIAKGEVIEPDLIADVPLVRRGDMVTVIARAGHVAVKTLGQALEEGTRGQSIKVRNLDTNRVFMARVQEMRTVGLSIDREGDGVPRPVLAAGAAAAPPGSQERAQ